MKDSANYLLPYRAIEGMSCPQSQIAMSPGTFTRELEDRASCIELNTHLFFKSWADRAKCMGLTSAIEFIVKKKD